MLRHTLATLRQLDEFLRLYQTGFVAVWPLLGLACVQPWTWRPVVALLVASSSFNLFGGILNDLCDLDSDRLSRDRGDRWLVTGVVSPERARVIVGLQLPIILVTHVVAGFRMPALAWMATALAGQAIYDVFGKRSRVPPLAEAAEGIAAGCLVLYGATCLSDAIGPLAWPTAASGVAFILLVNAFHGGLRDVEDDLAAGVRTTPIWLGCTGDRRKVRISRAMSVYAAACLAVLLILSSVIARAEGAGALTVTAIGAVVNVALFLWLHRLRKPAWDVALRIHVGMLMIPVMTAFSARLRAASLVMLLTIYVVPVLPIAWRLLRRRSDADEIPARGERQVAAREDAPPGSARSHLELGGFVQEHR